MPLISSCYQTISRVLFEEKEEVGEASPLESKYHTRVTQKEVYNLKEGFKRRRLQILSYKI